jgi:multidrug efflux pump subunit AcrA (membrane-fusion protein)
MKHTQPASRLPELFLLLLFFSVIITSCHNNSAANDDEAPADIRTPVTATSVSYDSMEDYIELNATSSFLQKSFVKSNLNGYVKNVYIKVNDFVNSGQRLFILKTKEAEAIGNSVNKLNPDFNFSGTNIITANTHGYIAELNHQPGDYVQDGEQLAVITDSRSFVFVMNVPYEDHPYVSIGKKVEITLPDQEHLTGTVSSAMPMIDSVSQTQSYAIKVNAPHSIPQNLIAKVRILKVLKTATPTLPRSSVLSDETQTQFWVMKMINDSTVIKVPVKTGLASGDKIEIDSPQFSPQDKILLTGNYGLPDTAGVIASPHPSKGEE